MINVSENYILVQDLLSKNNGVFISPGEYNRYASIASKALFDSYIGADTATKVNYGRNRTLDFRLAPFRETETLPVVSGVVAFPEDLAKINKVHTVDYKPIRPIDEDRLAVAHQDPYTEPGDDEIFYEETSDSIILFPADIEEVIFTYLKKPVEPVYAFTVGSNGRPVYDDANSVHMEWDKSQEMEITMRILQLCGVSMSHNQIIGYTQQKQNEE